MSERGTRDTVGNLFAMGPRIASFGLGLLLAACGGGQAYRNGVPVTQGAYKVGSPYQVGGVWYTPQEDWSYDAVGLASWYGSDFHGRRTANGETFNKEALTAAHKTLQLPVLAEVTNLSNGRSIVVRINDRGPFVKGRVIDVSERSAELLGFRQQGTVQVRVRVIGPAPIAIANHDDGASATGSRLAAATPPPSAAPAKPAAPANVALASAAPPPPVVPSGPSGGPLFAEPPASAPSPAAAPHRLVAERPLFIQAGTFSDPSNAFRVKGALEASRPSQAAVTVSTILREGRALYRVRIGPMLSADEADRTLRQVVALGHTGAMIVLD
ncbi:MAG: septal ring lytic transglycosylase RlpA family protein [Alphaproteobacteria bacterium]|nr:septal ring lytic transglycosylase RlpA family protein [Alphaproteobacteria bacterium]